jgi:hypothetical protein
MPRVPTRLSLAAVLLAALGGSASATPNCFRDPQPYALADDTVSWAMTIAPGADCIQGLRWSYMQIERVSLSSGPSNGKVVIVGPAFRYFADPAFRGSDTFTVSVSGKNRKASGKSILQIQVNARPPDVRVSAAQK